MTTRQEIWISNEILKFTDIIHDCLDACRYLLKGIDPDKGIPIKETQEYIDLKIKSYSRAALTHKMALIDFVTKITDTEVQNALNIINIDTSVIITDVNNMETYATYINNNVDTGDHAQMAAYLDKNLPKFVSVRRRWAL